MAIPPALGERLLLSRDGLAALLAKLSASGFTLLGPTVRDGAIVHDRIHGIADLPEGWTEEQAAGSYRLRRREDRALFGYAVGPQSWKPSFFVPSLQLWRARREDGSFVVLPSTRKVPRLALIGARSCDLHAIAIQDKVFLEGNAADPDYAARRSGTFVVAVQCGQAGGNCFCVSMETGPVSTKGFDIALTEVVDETRHHFVAEVGSAAGAEMLSGLPFDPATHPDVDEARSIVEKTARQMGRSLDTTGIKELLYRNLEHPQWDKVADRCLSCTNCTLVCPTCFCSSVDDVTDLDGSHAERHRRWDSCFTSDHSHVHGGSVRSSVRSRYRQWLTHKLASWIDQYGTSGCVGCGRCIAWCPVGIDITEEVAAIRATESA